MGAFRIRTAAEHLGFDVVGIAPAREAPHAAAYRAWLEAGHHADMQWLTRNPERRLDPGQVVPEARSVISLGVSYFTENPPAAYWDDPLRGRIARYAWGPDYHDVITPMLRAFVEFLHGTFGEEELGVRYYVDTGPVLERETAWQAGLGFIGRNSLLIHPGYGSYLFLAEVITSLELEPDAPATREGARIEPGNNQGKAGTCGDCRRCLECCPTGAIVDPYIIDSRKCISYQTIENKESIPPALAARTGSWIFGCDACQTACPWVHRYSRSGRKRFLQFDPDRFAPRLDELLTLDEEAFRDRYRGTPVARAKRRGLLRNAAAALGNSGCEEARAPLQGALNDPEPLVRAQAEWALRRLDAS